MTFATKKASKPGKLLSIVALAALLGGCGGEQAAIDNYSQHLAAYMENPNEQTLNNLKVAYVEIEHIGWEGVFETRNDVLDRLRRWRNIKAKTQKTLIDDAQWETLTFLYRNGMKASDEAEDLLSLKYKGNDAELLEAAGFGAYRRGEIYQAYKAFEGAALADTSRAFLPRGFAFHYGCADLYQIWGELEDSRKMFQGNSIPLSEPSLNHRELIEARTLLRKGIAPEISESCPIKPVEA